MATYRKQANGNVTVEICVGGIRKSKTFDTKTKAKIWAAEAESLLRKQVEGVSHTHTLGDIFDKYADEVSSKKKGAHWEIIRLKKFKTYPIASIKLVDLKREHFEVWMDSRDDVKPSTVNRELNLMSHCLTQARRWRLMTANPMSDLERPKNPPHRDRLISQDERDLVVHTLNYSEDSPPKQHQQRVALAFLFALETAMRVSEICGIKKEHIVGKTVFLPETKNGTSRYVPLSTEALRLLERLDGDGFELKPGSLSTTFKNAVKKAGLVNLTFHDARHQAITTLAKKLDVLDLARMVGHRDIRQLMTYYNKTAEELAQQLD